MYVSVILEMQSQSQHFSVFSLVGLLQENASHGNGEQKGVVCEDWGAGVLIV